MLDRDALVKKAIGAMEYSYSPYSGFRVGAALLCADGAVYTGCNIENAAFSPTNCAERTAIFKAVSEGKRDFTAIAVAGGHGDGAESGHTVPCGVCLQVLLEFCRPEELIVLAGDMGGSFAEYRLAELIPHGFRL